MLEKDKLIIYRSQVRCYNESKTFYCIDFCRNCLMNIEKNPKKLIFEKKSLILIRNI